MFTRFQYLTDQFYELQGNIVNAMKPMMNVFVGIKEVQQMLQLYQTKLAGEAHGRDRPSRRRSRSRHRSRTR